MSEKERRELLWVKGIGYSLLLYIGIATMCFAFANPKMTSTERFFHVWDALTWRGHIPQEAGTK